MNRNLYCGLRILLNRIGEEGNRPAAGSVAQGIRDKVGEHLIQPVIIGGDLLIRVGGVYLQINVLRGGLGGKTRIEI